MTLASTTPQVTYNGDGATVDFDFSFPMWTSTVTTELAVILDVDEDTEETLVYGTDYTLSASNNDYSSGGTVTTTETYASTQTITIRSSLTRSQEFSFTTNDTLNTENLEAAADRLVRMVQEAELQGTIEQTEITTYMKTLLTKTAAAAARDSLLIYPVVQCYENEIQCYENEIQTYV